MLKTLESDTIQTGSVIRAARFQPWSALKDILDGLFMWRIWSALAWHEFHSIYRRSIFGAAWVIMSFGAFLFIKIAIFSSLLTLGEPGYYDTYLILGFFVWFYISQSVSAAPQTFIVNQNWIKSEPLPLSLYVYKSALREFYGFALTSIAAALGIWFIAFEVKTTALAYSVLAIAMMVVSSCTLKFLLGTIASRFRDIGHLVRAIMLPMMFLTPIFWMPSQMERLMPYLWWNPFFHYIEIFRAPILTGEIPQSSWVFVGCSQLIISVLGFGLFARYRQRIVFWF